MDYRKLNDREIEITLGRVPISRVLSAMARISYESAGGPGSDFLELLDTQAKDMDFTSYIHLDRHTVLDMDYVNQRQCKTRVTRIPGGKFVFDAWFYKTSGRSPEEFLGKVKSALKKDFDDSGTRFEQYEQKNRWSRLEIVIDFILQFFT